MFKFVGRKKKTKGILSIGEYNTLHLRDTLEAGRGFPQQKAKGTARYLEPTAIFSSSTL